MANECPKCRFQSPEDTLYCSRCGTKLSPAEGQATRTLTIETPRQKLATGSTFAGRYQVIEELGGGGMGKVYKAYDQEIRAKVALKLIRAEIAEDPTTIERFRSELRLARDIVHKNICRMYDLGRDGETYYITMEYIPGEDLKSMIRMSGQLDVGTAVHIARELCDGLAEAHRLGILHRDLKPGNIMVDREGHARIMDFGIARSTKADKITGSGVITGTPEFMSPEMIEGGEIDERSDLYSLGIILYEMVTGRLPFEADTPFAVARKQTDEMPRDPRELNSRLPADLCVLILKCLKKDREMRYHSAGELGAELEKIEKTLPAADRTASPTPGSARKQKPTAAPMEITVKLSLRKLVFPITALIVLAIIAIFVGPRLLQKTMAPFVGQKLSIAVVSFENLTGDSGIDYLQKAVPNLLITSLEHSGFLNVTTWERMGDLLKQVGKGNAEFIDKDTGFELCRMEGVETIVVGSVVKAGNVYATDVKVLDVGSKRLLTSAKATGEGIDSILRTQIDELSRDVYRGVGLSEKEIRAARGKIAEVTTSSMEAYQLYLKGLADLDQYSYESARRYLERAVELDPAFAMAYAALFYVNTHLNDSNALYAALDKARAFSSRTTEKERLYIEASYTHAVEKNDAKYRHELESLIKKYPREKRYIFELANFIERNEPGQAVKLLNRALELDPTWTKPVNELALLYGRTGEYQKSLEELKKLASLSPEDPNVYETMGHTYFQMGQIDQAIARFKEALAIKPDFAWSLSSVAYSYAFKEEYGDALAWMDQYISRTQAPGVKMTGLLGRAFYLYWLGRRMEALAEVQKAGEIADRMGSERNKVMIDYFRGWIHADRGEYEMSALNFGKAFEFYKRKGSTQKAFFQGLESFALGSLDVRQGRTDSARARLREMETLKPEFYKEQIRYYADDLVAEIFLREGSPQKAIDVMNKATPHVVDYINIPEYVMRFNLPALKDVLAKAYLEKGDVDKAIKEYERLATFDPLEKSSFLVHPLYNYRLARLYEQKGPKAKAAERYRRFLDLWKDADADIAEVRDARNRLDNLGFKN